MMFKKITALLLAASVTTLFAACNQQTQNTDAENTTAAQTGDSQSVAVDASEYFSDGDYKDVTGETPNAEITLSGSEGTISDTTRGSSGETVTITSKGIYRVTGSSENVTIAVSDDTESGNIYIVLDNVTMTNDSAPCILVENADKVIVQAVGENKLTNSNTNQSAAEDAAIYAKDDITLNGSGSLTVNSSLHGVVCKNDLKITGGTVGVNAELIGLKAESSVRVGGGTSMIVAGHDGVQVKNNAEDGYFCITDGIFTVNAGYDGISADQSITASDGAVTVTAGGGSDNAKDGSVSQKGLKCADLAVAGGTFNVSAADDAVNCENFALSGGSLTLSTSDDGIHADSGFAVSGGDISITKSYEGIEAQTVAVAGGNISVYASDDGVNAAGGSDSGSTEQTPWSGQAENGALTVSGGYLYVNADGDGLDSNGSILVSGGTVIVEGPADSGNGALDKGDGNGCVAEITGGTVLALGSTGMAINFDSGSQCSALVLLSGAAGTEISVDDGSGFTFTSSKDFSCAVYSSPELVKGNTYTITAGGASATMDFSSGLYYSSVGGAMGGPGGNR